LQNARLGSGGYKKQSLAVSWIDIHMHSRTSPVTLYSDTKAEYNAGIELSG